MLSAAVPVRMGSHAQAGMRFKQCTLLLTSGDHRPRLTLALTVGLHVLQVSVSGAGSSRLDFTARGLQEVLRASVTYYNSEQELEVLVQALQELVDSAQQGDQSRV